jgi:hypothetical protein
MQILFRENKNDAALKCEIQGFRRGQKRVGVQRSAFGVQRYRDAVAENASPSLTRKWKPKGPSTGPSTILNRFCRPLALPRL